MLVSEIFGYSISDNSESARHSRENRICPFKRGNCTKSSETDPIGICSLANENGAASICPNRFLENDRIFVDAGRIAFGANCKIGIFPEVKILRSLSGGENAHKKIGKVDYLLGKIEDEKVTDFAALEVQAAYFSGKAIRPALNYFLANSNLDPSISDRRPDFRSSAQKRLMPQLQLKVPVFRRWGKKFFVVVDRQFFSSLPLMPTTTLSNSEIIWLAYPIVEKEVGYQLYDPAVSGTQWDDVVSSLREGVAPLKEEIVDELQQKLVSGGKRSLRTMSI